MIYEKRSRPGGHTSSHAVDGGFIFDEGPHVSFTKNPRIQTLLAESVEQKYEIIQAYANNYWKGRWIKHPAICNLHGLPLDLVVDIMKDVAALQHRERESEINSFADWLIASYGKTFSEVFPFQYNQKYHTTHPENLSTEWLGARLHNTVPEGAGSIQAEVYYSEKYKPMDQSLDAIEKRVIQDLRRCDLIRDGDVILTVDTRLLPYANVIFDLDRARCVETIHGYLRELGIHCCGRYGLWGYQWTDESFLSGEAAAENLLSQM